MIWLLKLVGSKTALTVAAALVVILTLYGVIQYTQSVERDRVLKDIQIEQLQDEVEMQRGVNEILRENREANPDRDGNIALQRLRSRYRSQE